MIPTGLYTLDLRLGGGLPQGAITEVFGPPSSAKTALAMHFIKNVPDGRALFMDADNDFPDDYARDIGVNLDNVDVGDFQTPLDSMMAVLDNYSLVVVDTITNLMALDIKDNQDVGSVLNARIEQLVHRVIESNVALVVLNQVRTPIGEAGYYRTTCGRLLKCYSSRRIHLEGGGYIRSGDNDSIGRTIHYKVLKVPGVQPYARQELSLFYETGISSELDAIRMGLQLGLLTRSGSWIHKKQDDGSTIALGQGLQGALDSLSSDSSWSSYCSQLSDAVAEHKTKIHTMNAWPIP